MIDVADVYGRYARDVYRFALYLSGNRAQAEDITSETFARAWIGRGQIRVGTVKAYLLMIARNLHRVAGEASPDTQALVDAFLAEDLEFARLLRENGSRSLLSGAVPALPPGHEARTFVTLRKKLRGHPWLFQLAMLFSCFAFGRIIMDTSWDVSPRNFIIQAAIAAAFLVAYFVSLVRLRRKFLWQARRDRGN